MKTVVFEHQSNFSESRELVFEWHKRPGAFQALCPPWMDVEIAEQSGSIQSGAHVALDLPVGPFKMRWTLEHRNYVEGRQFQDVQISGPFASWKHTHMFDSTQSGCLLKDSIEYQLPPTPMPEQLASLFLEKELKRMFDYRGDVLSHAVPLMRNEVETMKVAVTGSRGLIGSVLAPFITTQGHQLQRVVRPSSPRESGDVVWDPMEKVNDLSALEGVDAVIHLAGENIASGRWDADKKSKIKESRVVRTRLLSEGLAKLKKPPRILLCASAIGYYGDRGNESLDETSSGGKGFLAELCRDWEQSTIAARESGIRVVYLRLGVVLSPRGGALAKMLPPFQFGAGGQIGSGQQYMSWIAIDDVAGAIYHCLNQEALSGPVNIVAPHAVTNAEFTKVLGHVLHRPTLLPVPDFGVRMVFGEMADELLLSSAKVKPTKLESTAYKFMYPDLDSALRHVLGK